MRKFFAITFGLLFTLLLPVGMVSVARANHLQDQNTNTNSNKRKLHVPHRHRRSGTDKPKNGSIGHAYKQGGQSAGRGGKRFGRHIRHGRPGRGGKEFGKGMGGFGKGVGKGTARTGKKVGRKIKHAVTP